MRIPIEIFYLFGYFRLSRLDKERLKFLVGFERKFTTSTEVPRRQTLSKVATDLSSGVRLEVGAFDARDDQPRPVVVEGEGRSRRRRDVEPIDVNSAFVVFEVTILVDFLPRTKKASQPELQNLLASEQSYKLLTMLVFL